MSSASRKLSVSALPIIATPSDDPSPFGNSSRDEWEYIPDAGLYRNRSTGEVAEEPDTDIPAVGTVSASAEEEGVTVPESQFRAGVRLAISGRSGLIRRCPLCRRRRLLIVPRGAVTFLTCAGNFAAVAGDGEESAVVGGACDFERKLP